MRSLVLVLCIAYAYGKESTGVHQRHHNQAPDADSDDLEDKNLRFYISKIKNSGAAKVRCAIKNVTNDIWSIALVNLPEGHHVDVLAPELASVDLSATLGYSLECVGENNDAVYIKKIQYRNGADRYQASVENVFDDVDTCNTANMQLKAGNCPSEPQCVGKDFDKKGGNCVACKPPRNGIVNVDEDHSPCALYYAEDTGETNKLGYKQPSKECNEGKHQCSRPQVKGVAKCCSLKKQIHFKLRKDQVDILYRKFGPNYEK